MRIICDCHLHSENSFDAKNPVQEMCQTAMEKGFNTIAITDHMEAPEISLGEKSEYGDMLKQIRKSVEDTRKCKEIYKDKLNVLVGMELGEPMHNPELTKKALSIADFDFILASVHNLKNQEDFYFMDYSTLDINKLLKAYFTEVLDTAQNAEFDSLAHLTYPLRYIVERTGKSPDLSQFKDLIDNIFLALIEREKALEINTSGLFKPIGTTLPDINLVKRFNELGGKYVTLGSDAHNTKDLGQGIEKGVDVARICGFEHYTIFENHQPRMIEIWY